MIKVGIVSIIDTIDHYSDIEDYYLDGNELTIIAWYGDEKIAHRISGDGVAEMYGRKFIKWCTDAKGAPEAIIMQ